MTRSAPRPKACRLYYLTTYINSLRFENSMLILIAVLIKSCNDWQVKKSLYKKNKKAVTVSDGRRHSGSGPSRTGVPLD